MSRRFPIAAVLVIPLLTGMLGCAIGSPGPPTERPGEGTIALHSPPDAELERRLTAIFAGIDGLQAVGVRVHDGVVHLTGTTDQLALEQRAVTLASRLEGVVDVTSEISSRPPDRMLAATWRTLRRFASSAVNVLPQLGAALLVLVPFLLLSLLVGRWHHPFRLFGVRQLTGSLVRFVLRGALILGGILLGLDVLGITGLVGAVVGTLGVLGLAAGIVFKDWVANYFPAMMLGIHPPFKAGDLVQVGEHEGRVVQITPRATVLMTLDGAEVRLPNSALFERTLVNYSRHRERRLRFVVPLALRADLHLAQDVGRKALLQLHGIAPEPPPFMRTRTLARDFVEVEFFAWVDQHVANFRAVESRARRVVLESLTSSGLPFPVDARLVRLQQAPGATIDDDSEAEELDEAFVQHKLDRAMARESS